jgi:hypothetical protein
MIDWLREVVSKQESLDIIIKKLSGPNMENRT